MRPSMMNAAAAAMALLLVLGCAAPEGDGGPKLHYVGSSTIAHFIRDADTAYEPVRFVLDTAPESAGGQTAIAEGRADLAGCAGVPSPETLALGVESTAIGFDSIAVIVHPENPVRDLSLAQLRDVFTGVVRNWRQLGGPDLEIRPLVVGPESATRHVFRAAVLGREEYRECEVVRPDDAIRREIAGDPAAIAPLSIAFSLGSDVRTLAIEGQLPTPDNATYPIVRPLHLLWWPGRRRVAAFIEWIQSPAGQDVVRRRFALAPGR